MRQQKASERTLLVGLYAAAFLWIVIPGTSRSYLYDESVTVGSFVETESVSSVFTNQIVFNNHIGTSFVAHLRYRLGLGGELSYRLVSVAFAAATVVLTYRMGRRYVSATVGVTAAVALCALPVFRYQGFQVRGYAAMTFLVLLSTAHLIDYGANGRSNKLGLAYYLAFAAAVCFNLYSLVPVALHGLVLVALRPHGWLDATRRLGLAALVGLATYSAVLGTMRSASNERQGAFDWTLPADLLWELLGGTFWLVGAIGACLIAGTGPLRSWLGARWIVVGLTVTFASIWVVLKPADVYPRMWIWLLPGVAIVAATGAQRHRLLSIALTAALSASLIKGAVDVLTFGGDRSVEQVGSVLHAVALEGNRPCAVLHSNEPLLAYVETDAGNSRASLRGCDVVYSLPSYAEEFHSLELDRTYMATSPDGADMFLIGWTDSAGRRSPTLARIESSGQASSSWFDS